MPRGADRLRSSTEVNLRDAPCLGGLFYEFSTGKVVVVPPYEVPDGKHKRGGD